jgi:hypothetical protein
MYKRSVTAPAVRMSIVFLGVLCFIIAIIMICASRASLSTGSNLDIDLDIYVMTVSGLLMFGIAIHQSRHAIIVDENGVRANIGRNKGNIPWDNVGEIGIISTIGGERTFYIVSKNASPYIGSAALAFSKPSDDLIKVGYNKELLEAIEKHYSGPIWGKKKPKADTKK